jgi:TonB family protein
LALFALLGGSGVAAASNRPFCYEQEDPRFLPAPDLPGPLETRAVSIAADNPVPRHLETRTPAYPDAENRRIRGTLTLRITIDADGRVAEVRRPFSPDYSVLPSANGELLVARPLGSPFLEVAEAAIRRWRYEKPQRAPISLFVRLAFEPERTTSIVWHHRARPPLPHTRPPDVAATPLMPPNCSVPIGGTIATPRKTRHVPPVYPPVEDQGTVILETTIRADGKVGNVRVLRSIAPLDQAAVDAVRQWEFEPTVFNGRAVSVVMAVSVTFKR